MHPAVACLLDRLGAGLDFAQVRIRPLPDAHELRHTADRDRPDAALQTVSLPELRTWARFSADGHFRPLRTAPTLRAGWRFVARDRSALEAALHQLYPGALADWHAADILGARPTPLAAFLQRQSGQYSETQRLPAVAAVRLTRLLCAPSACLRHRRWETPDAAPNAPPAAGAARIPIPCLEPCAVFLEAARREVSPDPALPAPGR